MKKTQLYDRAESLYVEELWTFEQIATELECSDRALRNWAKEGRWEQKRTNFKSAQERLSDDVRGIAILLAQKIKGQLEDDLEPSPHVLNAFTRMASSLIRVREYDKEVEQSISELSNPSTDEQDKVRKDAMAKFKEVFGVDLELPSK